MIFTETKLPGVYTIDLERLADERGFFARAFCVEEFTAQGLQTDFPQCNISYNEKQGTLRGMHYQAAPYGEVKLIRCTMGAVYDVALDLRPDSPTFKQWAAVELSAENRRMLYIPVGVAHGFQSLQDHTELFYMMGTVYHPDSARGVRWDDPAFGIEWPKQARYIISDRDRSYPLRGNDEQ